MHDLKTAARRAVSAMMWQMGAMTARMEIPAPPIAGDDGAQIGLGTPLFQVHVLAPVALQVTKDSAELLVAADVLEDVLGATEPGQVQSGMATVFAVVVGDVRYRVSSVVCVYAMGGACLYRVQLAVPGTEVV